MRLNILRALVLCALVVATSASAAAQTPNDSRNPEQTKPPVAAAPVGTAGGKVSGSLFGLEDMRRQLSEQHSEIEELRAALKEQSRLIGELRSRVEHAESEASSHASPALVRDAVYATGAGDSARIQNTPAGAEGAAQGAKLDERMTRAEQRMKKTSDAVGKQLGSLTFGGNLRFRYESFYGQQNALASSDTPGAFGNPLSTRQRFRLRARFDVKGSISDEFEWGLRLATGSFADMISTNQTLTDFFTRKPFALDQAYITYKPKALHGFQIQAGKFETPWTRTEMTWDNDISTEGLAETYTFRDDSPQFYVGGFKDPASLAAKLRNSQDSVSLYLRKKLSLDTQDELNAYDASKPLPEKLQRALVGELNQLLKDDGLFNAERFAQLQLTATVKELIAQKAKAKERNKKLPDEDLIHLNRLLLETAYPDEMARGFKDSTFKNIALQAWQLPLLERNAAFVLGADGKVDLSASGRAGRDLALYGAQLRTEIAPTKNVSLKLSASDLYFSGTQFISPAQVFGANIQLPVTFTIPASGTTPARTITTQVSVPRELLVAGNGNLGLSLANTNAVNRDGRLASGYNLVDLIARADFTRSKRWPVMLLLNFVTNTQTHDVVTAGPGGADVLLPNHEGQGFWGEFQIGKDVLRLPVDKIARGDVMLNYTFLRVEKDAILSPFNGSDLGQSTDMRVHRFIVGYALDPRVAVTLTGFFTSRPNGLLGAFVQTPPGSLDRRLTRLQFDTIMRF